MVNDSRSVALSVGPDVVNDSRSVALSVGPDVVNDSRSVALLVVLMWLMTLGL